MLQLLAEKHLTGELLVLAIIVLLLLLENFKPIHRQWQWFKVKMPPGPPGIPIYGNLLQFFKERDAGRFVPYVSAPLGLCLL